MIFCLHWLAVVGLTTIDGKFRCICVPHFRSVHSMLIVSWTYIHPPVSYLPSHSSLFLKVHSNVGHIVSLHAGWRRKWHMPQCLGDVLVLILTPTSQMIVTPSWLIQLWWSSVSGKHTIVYCIVIRWNKQVKGALRFCCWILCSDCEPLIVTMFNITWLPYTYANKMQDPI